MLTAYACAVVAARLLFGEATDRFGARWTALASAGLQAAGLLVFAAAGTLSVAVAAGILIGCGVAHLYPALTLLALKRRDRHERSVIAATLGSFVDIGIAIGAPMAGLVAAQAGYTAVFVILAAIVLASVAAIVAVARADRERSDIRLVRGE